MKITEIDTREGYNLWSETYDHNGNPLVALENEVLDQLLGEVQGLQALDLGCGTGRNSIKLYDRGAKVVGVDLSEGMLKKAQFNSGERSIEYILGDLNQTLNFPNSFFDLVVSSLVLEHIKNLTPLFREMGRVCKGSGFILASDLHPAMKLKDAQAQFTDKKTGQDFRPRGYPHTLSDYMLALRDSGLALVDVVEFSGTAALAEKFPKMRKYIDWPMLVVFKLKPKQAI